MIVVETHYFILRWMTEMSNLFPVSIDIETANLGPGTPGQKVNPADWEIACVAAYDSLTNVKYLFVPFEDVVVFDQDPEVNAHNLASIIYELSKASTADFILPLHPLKNMIGSFADCLKFWSLNARYFLAHRGHNFDWPILGHHLGLDEAITVLNLRNAFIDTHASIQASTGLNCGLSALMTAALGVDEGKILSGKDAPKLWTDGIKTYQADLSIDNLTLVMDYCLDDAVKTYQVYEKGLSQKYLEVIPYDSKSVVRIPIVDWGHKPLSNKVE